MPLAKLTTVLGVVSVLSDVTGGGVSWGVVNDGVAHHDRLFPLSAL